MHIDYDYLFHDPTEQPLDRLVTDGGLCRIFRTIGCVGDSMSSGEFETRDDQGKPGYHDYFQYSWGQYLARMCGCTVYNFSRGGMTAKEYCESFADLQDYWNRDKACQAYILALGANDVFYRPQIEMGSLEDVHWKDWRRNRPTFTGYYCQILQRLKENQPLAKFFLMTLPRDALESEQIARGDAHAQLLRQIAASIPNTYVLDIRQYGPDYDGEFHRHFFLHGHMNPAGYLLTAQMVASYIDYIVRHNMDDFHRTGLIGSPYQMLE